MYSYIYGIYIVMLLLLCDDDVVYWVVFTHAIKTGFGSFVHIYLYPEHIYIPVS